jgi:hypothetical protein
MARGAWTASPHPRSPAGRTPWRGVRPAPRVPRVLIPDPETGEPQCRARSRARSRI